MTDEGVSPNEGGADETRKRERASPTADGAGGGEGNKAADTNDNMADEEPRPAKRVAVGIDNNNGGGTADANDPSQFDDPDEDEEESDCGTPPPSAEGEGTNNNNNNDTNVDNVAANDNAAADPEAATQEATEDPPAEADPPIPQPVAEDQDPSAPPAPNSAATGAQEVEEADPVAPSPEEQNLFTLDRQGTDPPPPAEPVGTSNPGHNNPSTNAAENNPGNAAATMSDPPDHHPAPNPGSNNPGETYASLASVPRPPRPPPVVVPAVPTTVAPAPVDPTVQPTLLSPATAVTAPTVASVDDAVEETEQVSSQLIGKVIGKGGEAIRDLQTRSGARIEVEQNVPAGLPRTVTYRGTRDDVDFAKTLVRMLTVEGVSENELPLGKAQREVLHIPAQSVGKIIGRAGDMVREIQSRSGARVQVEHSTGTGVPVDKKQVTITGSDLSVTKAKEMIMFLVSNPMMEALTSLNMLVEDKVRGGTWGSGPPYLNMPNQGYNMTPEMVAPGMGGGAPSAMVGAYPPGMGAAAYGGAPYGAVAGAYGAPVQAPYQGGGGPAYPPYGGPVPSGGGAGAVEVDVMYVQKQYTGRIIGQRGVTVNDLQRRSGCDIQINQQAVGHETEVTIRGTRQGIEHVKQMIQEIIEAGPGHPYAGGADSGYGAGGGGRFGGGGGGGGYGGYPPQQQVPMGYDYGQQAAYGAYPPQQGYGQYNQPYGQPQQQQQQQPVPQQPMAYGQVAGYGQQVLPQQQQLQQQPAAYGAVGYGVPPAPPQPQPPRVTPWKTANTPDGQVYYYNEQTGETQWDKPPGM